MKHEGVQHLFGAAAARWPDRAAVSTAAGEVTYRELDKRSNNVANFLVSSGAGRGSVVAVLSEDAVEVITSVLGILKAGCVFVPLDAGIPDKRLETMIATVSPSWVVCEPRHFERLGRIAAGAGVAAQVISSSDGHAAGAGLGPRLTFRLEFAEHWNPRPVGVESEGDDMAYVYFTSGSTGRPKGIAGRLKGIDHFIRWELKTLGLGEGVRVSQLLPASFDGSLRDIFVPLCAGGTVCVPEGRETLLDAGRLVEWLDRSRVNVVHCVPSVFRSVLNAGLTPSHFEALKYVLMAGEPLLPSDVKRWADVFGARVRLVNLYGTSETTMAKFAYFVRPEDAARQTIPVGKPIEGAAAVVVDARGRACAPGIIGEIYIRTPYCTLGYYNQPELTSEVFVQNPFSDNPRDIVHKTGDLGRVLEDGNFEYLGRKDQQVKIRGVRVELGEIENLLRAQPSVRDVAVIDCEGADGYNYLCAYLVLEAGAETAALRDALALHLPDYMIPSAMVTMESLPRTISGKIDRRTLPAPHSASLAAEGAYVAPRTPTEELVTGVWGEVLGVARVGVEHNFFQLGGHSLRATQVLSRVRSATGVQVPLRAFFEAPTVAGLARHVEAGKSAGAGPAAPAITRAPRDGALPLSFAQQRLWFLHRVAPESPFYNIPVAVRLTGALDAAALERAINEIVRRHEALRTTFQTVGRQPAQIVAPRLTLGLPVSDISALGAEEHEARLQALIADEARRPFDLARGPLLRAGLVRVGEDEHVLLFNMHHIVSDAWSLGVLVREAAALYTAFSAGEPSPLPELSIQYADYAVWQREWLTGDVLEAHLSYWREQLAGVPTTLALPYDRPRPEGDVFRGARHPLSFSAELTEQLRALGRGEGATLFMTLLAAYQLLLHKHTGQHDIVVGSPIANRDRPELEQLIGLFLNTLALRGRPAEARTFRELLAQVRATTLSAYAHQELPFDRVVSELQPERDLGRSTLFHVWFVLQNTPQTKFELPGLTMTPAGGYHETSQFDLSLNLAETPDGLRGSLEYNADLFEPGTVARLARHLALLLEAAAARPDAALEELRRSLDDADLEEQRARQRELKEARRRRIEGAKLSPRTHQK
ncbi:MAG: amino acid adenylation domain-containing protein [Acidobacteria bacterium]|nr:amino acid adenylation domain-containing protein [Acidobacteriota bacterium]